MPFLLAGGLALLLLMLLLRSFANASPATIRAVLAWSAGGIGAGIIALLVISGREGLVVWALGLFGPLLWRWWQGRRAAAQFGATPASTPNVSAVETSSLHMEVAHGSGHMSGTVRRGRFAGRDLRDLTELELLALLRDCAAVDAESVPLLEAWLDRAHPAWREVAGAAPDAEPSGSMSPETARAVLGVGADASPGAIRAAHRRLMASAHPDRGGDHARAARLNQARDVLLRP